MEKLTWTVEKRKVADLKNWDKNPRKITEEAFAKLKERISKRGYHGVIKTDGHDVIISGNQGKRALEDLGIEEVWTMVPSRDLTEEEKNAVAIESNKHDGVWDMDMLSNQFDSEFLFDLGFTTPELAGFEERETKMKHIIDCPHCRKQIGLSNRVARVEPVLPSPTGTDTPSTPSPEGEDTATVG